MGIFGWNKRKSDAANPTSIAELGTKNSIVTSDPSYQFTVEAKRGRHVRQKSKEPVTALEQLPELIHDLVTAVDPGHDRPLGALRALFAISEHAHDDNRKLIVHAEKGLLVPTLLQFLGRCAPKSSEQYLALLVINNISIPMENKEAIAVQHSGAKLLSTLLCCDPSCHLLAIILVNLTFSNANLISELVSEQSGIGLVESLAFALRVASLTHEELEKRQTFIDELTSQTGNPPKDMLAMLMAEDQRLRNATNTESMSFPSGAITDPCRQCFPETARWCLSAMKNLTRPCNDSSTAHVLITSGIFSLIRQYILIPKETTEAQKQDMSAPSSSSDSTSMADPNDAEYAAPSLSSTPSMWSTTSIQDAALYIVLNLASCTDSRDYVVETGTIDALCAIAHFPEADRSNTNEEQVAQREFQCLKARMALAYLLGSQGNFGQNKLTSITSTIDANPDDSPLIMSEADVELLVELLMNTLHQKGKEGPGGYSVSSFSIKYVIYALRCLLTHTTNQYRAAALAGIKLNTLLLKAVAQFSLLRDTPIDMEAAEQAIFCLYLLSNMGFEQSFLPAMFSNEQEHGELAAKIFTAYRNLSTTANAGKHAVEQLLLRIKYLVFEEDPANIGEMEGLLGFEFGDVLLEQIQSVELGVIKSGAKPMPDIFDRPILRTRKPKKGRNVKGPWENRAGVSAFANALQAVQQLSYGSIKVRHIDPIDDIMIANTIADSANGEKTDSYNFMWTWEDKVSEISRNLERPISTEARTSSLLEEVSARFSQSTTRSGPVSFFQCGSLCTVDETI